MCHSNISTVLWISAVRSVPISRQGATMGAVSPKSRPDFRTASRRAPCYLYSMYRPGLRLEPCYRSAALFSLQKPANSRANEIVARTDPHTHAAVTALSCVSNCCRAPHTLPLTSTSAGKSPVTPVWSRLRCTARACSSCSSRAESRDDTESPHDTESRDDTESPHDTEPLMIQSSPVWSVHRALHIVFRIWSLGIEFYPTKKNPTAKRRQPDYAANYAKPHRARMRLHPQSNARCTHNIDILPDAPMLANGRCAIDTDANRAHRSRCTKWILYETTQCVVNGRRLCCETAEGLGLRA